MKRMMKSSKDQGDQKEQTPTQRYYSIEETASILKTSPEGIFKMFTGKSEHLLFPSVYVHNSKQMYRRIEKESGRELIHECLSGWFEIDGIYDLEWDADGYGRLTFGGKSRVLLHKDQLTYILTEEYSIHKTDLMVSDDELKHYMQMRGIDWIDEIAGPLQVAPQCVSNKKRNNLPDRKGKTVPEDKRRKKAEFSLVIREAFDICREGGNLEILQPGNVTAFLKYLKKLVADKVEMKDKKRTYEKLIEEIKPSSNGNCVMMTKPRTVRGHEAKDYKWYTRNDVSRMLSELRSEHRDVFPLPHRK